MLRDIELAFIRLHILHHAAEGEVFGIGLMEELARHGYTITPGTLYPTLAKMENAGLLRSENRVVEHKQRRYYTITPEGKALLDSMIEKIVELHEELVESR
jgi:PadR family transcriptional regulator, regulatory protein PadR